MSAHRAEDGASEAGAPASGPGAGAPGSAASPSDGTARFRIDEARTVRRWQERPPERVLVASDLHLSAGLEPDTGMYRATENFLADQAFARWLRYYDRRDGSTTLILAGDVFDFLRVTEVPETAADYRAWAAVLARAGDRDRARHMEELASMADEERRRSPKSVVSRKEERYGLRTHDFKTVWKLQLVVRGHEPVFDALSRWVENGNRLLVVKGNHDVELHWPLVRAAIRQELVERAEARGGTASPDHIVFVQESTRLGNVHVEHGHRFEAMTAVITERPVLEEDPEQISLPLGSFVNRYFINGIERLNPFIDNVKPVTGALVEILRRHPLQSFRLYTRGWRFVSRALHVRTRRGATGPIVLIALLLIVPPLALLLLLLYLFAEPLGLGWIRRIPLLLEGSIFGAVLPAAFPFLIGVVRELGRLFGLKPKNHLVEGAEEIAREELADVQADRRYVVMGHSHWQEVRRLDSGPEGTDAFYVNTGTWIPIWPRDRADLIGQVRYSFVLFRRSATGNAYRGEAMVWDDHAKEPRRAALLADS